jgi:hypothetical protein
MNPFSIWKLINGFFPTSGERAGKLLFYCIFIVIALSIYHKVFMAKTEQTIIRDAKQVTIQEAKKDTAFCILKLWHLRVLSWE